MKYIIIITLSILVTTASCLGQTVNQLPGSEFEKITINSVSIREIMKTNGDASKMPQALGKPQDIQEQKSNRAPASTHIEYDGHSIGFSELLNAKGNLTRIDILKSKVLLNISGTEFFIGKDIGENLKKYKINNQRNGGKSLLFSPKYDSTIVISISFNDENIVTKIVYFVLT